MSPLPFGDRLLGFSVAFPPSVLEVAARSLAAGEGLGGGTPPNRTRREQSELLFGGVWGGAVAKNKVIHRRLRALLSFK